VTGSYGRSSPAIPNILSFSGQQPALEAPGHLVVVNTHNYHPVLGHLGLLNSHRVVYPLRFGDPGGLDDWSLADWCDQCHRKSGLVVWTKTAHEAVGFRFGEPLADLILGKVDAFEIDAFEDSPFDVLADWYGLLQCGLRVPLAGASGKDNNGMLLGGMRTYARLQPREELSYKHWIEAVRAGRTFVTNGPLLSFSVNGQEPGASVRLSSGVRTVHVRAEGRSNVPFDQLEIIVNGKVVAETPASGAPAAAVLETEVPLPSSGWLAARCRGERQVLQRPANQRVFAHTSPVYIQVEGQPTPVDGAVLKRFVTELDRMLEWVAREARCKDERQREHLAEFFRAARQELLRRGAAV
jgi:hypothetical protein